MSTPLRLAVLSTISLFLISGVVKAASAYTVSVSFISSIQNPLLAKDELTRDALFDSRIGGSVRYIDIDLRGIWSTSIMFGSYGELDSKNDGKKRNITINDAQNYSNPQRVYAGQTVNFVFTGIYSGVCQDFSNGPVISVSGGDSFKRTVRLVESELYQETLNQVSGFSTALGGAGTGISDATKGQDKGIGKAAGTALERLIGGIIGLVKTSTCGSVTLTVIERYDAVKGISLIDVLFPK